MSFQLMTLFVESALHLGSGQALDAIDLPILRERATDWPYVPGSSIKGVLRDVYVKSKNPQIRESVAKFFGPEHGSASEHAGALAFSDFLLLAMPVRCQEKGFMHITSPKVLARAKRLFERCGLKDLAESVPVKDVLSAVAAGDHKRLTIEEFEFDGIKKDSDFFDFCCQWDDLMDDSPLANMSDSLIVLPDEEYQYFVRNATEVVARIAIDSETGTVKDGALFYEEFLPVESILIGSLGTAFTKVIGDNPAKDFENGLPTHIQIGAGASIGKGLCSVKIWGDRA